MYSSSKSSNPSTNTEVKTIPKNLLEDSQTSHLQAENGAIFDKKPFKIHLEANKIYSWCLCGKSKCQPICDGMHKNEFLKIKLRPVRFQVEKTGDYWLCNCKQTKHRPFCDGTHKQADIQAAVR
ncbi:PREDICTED: CDGSH iron-sulfur domain-containing protein 3, mitochondrial isoform X2 [Rhagoletis zephyria]|nr:PREDICTED: CDGSH iron-sulfur domain-containing protein 3, mitochondrial isoform X2 [Rhagoletis zephyria]XP_036331521.1 CDGSH iron-sulfur domain-containing protein 3, mitochondrial isoform X3 [Rhagoletis pomonella]XP_036331522.1 CDGSH iron-sulfur domain-containing protein 3, mitochondrial isoform X3 [Rhagoletis pomonella]